MTKNRHRPTAAELAILNILWDRGSSTVREVHEALSGEKAVGYTSVLKVLQIMTEKGLVKRDEAEKAHVYSAGQPAEKTRKEMVRDLVQTAFGGSASQLMMHALSGKQTPASEIEEIRRILDEFEEGRK